MLARCSSDCSGGKGASVLAVGAFVFGRLVEKEGEQVLCASQCAWHAAALDAVALATLPSVKALVYILP